MQSVQEASRGGDSSRTSISSCRQGWVAVYSTLQPQPQDLGDFICAPVLYSVAIGPASSSPFDRTTILCTCSEEEFMEGTGCPYASSSSRSGSNSSSTISSGCCTGAETAAAAPGAAPAGPSLLALGRGLPLDAAVDDLGRRSGQAQGLTGPITSVEKLMQLQLLMLAGRTKRPDETVASAEGACQTQQQQAMQLLVLFFPDKSIHGGDSGSSVSGEGCEWGPQGFIRFGMKHLYFYRRNGSVVEVPAAPCVLDFFVSERRQRAGVGKLLFDAMLQLVSSACSGAPSGLAYDRPSPKLLAFMRKHFQLSRPMAHPNRFTTFEGFPPLL